ncbi:DUF3923 domain-containing protein [Staphylococcus pseudintermedius]|uniref:DUF3923 family protein n=1 Tax=Staphylococcus TaxID=1279 RepID=UPI0019E28FD9|nr:DUF3923 family protein [Staphylococcus pseudintermedius]EGQ3940679.1 DUF3923 domain-containing protein [Staphylococcus pseudintermedius]MDF0070685.1 DUF3923 family protein [Staphylococcus pseudintermedius]MDF0082664.1 DUF3923 family protein [Staphylococcus pseudintermedius]
MRASWIAWWVVNAFWLAIFLVGSIFIWTREVDAAGVNQTFDAKLAAFIVLLVAFLFPLMIQITWLIINVIVNLINKKNEKNNL